jgi:predicted MPP superfamily phosphohydrolase
MFMSDLHLSGKPGSLEEMVGETIEREHPQVLVLGGDVVDHLKYWDYAVEWLLSLRGPRVRFAVPGNWEYKRGGSQELFKEQMRASGFIPLCNESYTYSEEGGAVRVVGLDDVRKGHPDPETACRDVAEGEFTIMACHSPDILMTLDPAKFDMLLCGHTHGGQVRIPGIGALVTSTHLWKRFEAGLYQVGEERCVYVSRGLSGAIKLRIFCPPELVLVSLHHKD